MSAQTEPIPMRELGDQGTLTKEYTMETMGFVFGTTGMTFGMLGFIFALSATSSAGATATKIAELEERLKESRVFENQDTK